VSDIGKLVSVISAYTISTGGLITASVVGPSL
jgi:hypothetical protein